MQYFSFSYFSFSPVIKRRPVTVFKRYFDSRRNFFMNVIIHLLGHAVMTYRQA